MKITTLRTQRRQPYKNADNSRVWIDKLIIAYKSIKTAQSNN